MYRGGQYKVLGQAVSYTSLWLISDRKEELKLITDIDT
jgi:hypothetical protein